MRDFKRFLLASAIVISVSADLRAQSAITSTIENLGSPLGDLLYTPLTPCRVIDTRLAVLGKLGASETRGFRIVGFGDLSSQGGSPTGCGVSLRASAVHINFVAVNPEGGGNLRGNSYPNPVPAMGSIINYQLLTPPLNIANAVNLPVCLPGTSCPSDITLFANGAATHVVADVLGYFSAFPALHYITGLGPNDDTDNGRITSRTLAFTKLHANTNMRISYTDNFRVLPTNSAGRWEIRVNGVSCPMGALVYDYYVNTEHTHRSTTVVGYCGGIAAGNHTVQVWAGPAPGYPAVNLYTGWNASSWVLEAQEVP